MCGPLCPHLRKLPPGRRPSLRLSSTLGRPSRQSSASFGPARSSPPEPRPSRFAKYGGPGGSRRRDMSTRWSRATHASPERRGSHAAAGALEPQSTSYFGTCSPRLALDASASRSAAAERCRAERASGHSSRLEREVKRESRQAGIRCLAVFGVGYAPSSFWTHTWSKRKRGHSVCFTKTMPDFAYYTQDRSNMREGIGRQRASRQDHQEPRSR